MNGDNNSLLGVFLDINPLLVKHFIKLLARESIDLYNHFRHIDFRIILVHNFQGGERIFK